MRMFSSSDPVFAVIDPSGTKGLEIGPLTNPKAPKSEGNVMYLDHVSTEELRKKYASNQQLAPTMKDLVDVDIVQVPGRTILEAVGPEAPFDYVIAAHVIEHVPNVVGWLQETSSVLTTGGILSLVIPDKRYTFDLNRTPTELSELVDSYIRALTNPTFRQIFDFFSRTVTIDGMVDTEALWAGTIDYIGVVRDDVRDAMVAAYEVCQEQAANPSVMDIHCHVFTPDSFVALLEGLVRLGLTDFEVAELFPTARNALEFHVSLRKLEGIDLVSRQLASVERLLTPASQSRQPAVSESGSRASNHVTMEVSNLERRIVLGKRRLLGAMRRITSQ